MPQDGTVLSVAQIAIQQSLAELWNQFVGFLPTLVAAVVVFVVGWLIAVGVGRLVQQILTLIRLNEPFEKVTGLRATLERAGLDLNVPKFFGGLVKWFFYIVTLVATVDILGLSAIKEFLLEDVLGYLPSVVVAAVILVAGVIFANFVGRVTRASIEAARLPHSAVTSAVAKWAVAIFALLAALFQLGIGSVLIQTIVTAFFAMVAIAGGLAFGLGGKEMATKVLKHLESDVSEK